MVADAPFKPLFEEVRSQTTALLQASASLVAGYNVSLAVSYPLSAPCTPDVRHSFQWQPGSASEVIFSRSEVEATFRDFASVLTAGVGMELMPRGCNVGVGTEPLNVSATVTPVRWDSLKVGGGVHVQPALFGLLQAVSSGASTALNFADPPQIRSDLDEPPRCGILRASLLSEHSDFTPQTDSVSMVSDALPPLVLRIEPPVSPSRGELLTVQCVSSDPSLAELNSSTITVSGPPANGHNASIISGGVALWPLFQGGSAPAGTLVPFHVDCAVTSSFPRGSFPAYSDSNFSVPVVFVHSAIPLIGDAAIDVLNIAALPVPNETAATPGIARRALGASGAFEILISAEANITVYRDEVGWLGGGFDNPTSSWCSLPLVGSQPCAVLDVAPDGTWIRFQTPQRGLLCESDKPCPSWQLSFWNPVLPGFRVGALLSCPPFCPTGARQPPALLPVAISYAGAVGAGYQNASTAALCGEPEFTALIAPLAFLGPSAPSAVRSRAALRSGVSVSVLRQLSAADVPVGGGVTYFDGCAGAADANWLDPYEPECRELNASMARPGRARLCAYGERGVCRPCPVGARCPGGKRAYANGGYWTTDPSDDTMTLPCEKPKERCDGFNETLGRNECGPGYKGVACSACAGGYFPDAGNACQLCPTELDRGQVFLTILYIGLTVLGVVIEIVVVGLVFVRLLGGGSVKGTVERARKLLLLLVGLTQLQVQLSDVVLTNRMHPLLRSLYSALARVNFEGLAVHPACTEEGGILAQHQVTYTVVLCLLLALLLSIPRPRAFCRRRGCEWWGLLPAEQRAIDAALAAADRAVNLDLIDDEDEEGAAQVPGISKARNGLARWLEWLTRAGASEHTPAEVQHVRLTARKEAARREVLGNLSSAMQTGMGADLTRAWFQWGLLIVLSLLYASTAKIVFSTLRCETATIKVSEYRNLEADGSAGEAQGVPWRLPPLVMPRRPEDVLNRDPFASKLIDVPLLAVSPFTVCNELRHREVAPLASAVAAIFIVGLPLGLLSLGIMVIRLSQSSGRGLGCWPVRRVKGRRDEGCKPDDSSKTHQSFQDNPISLHGRFKPQAANRGRVFVHDSHVLDISPDGQTLYGNPLARAGGGRVQSLASRPSQQRFSHSAYHESPLIAEKPDAIIKQRTRQSTIRKPINRDGLHSVPFGTNAPSGPTLETNEDAPPLPAWVWVDLSGLHAWVFESSEYRPSHMWFKTLDLAVSAYLGGASKAWPSSPISSAFSRAAVTLLVLIVNALLICTLRPYSVDATWVMPFKLLHSILLMCLTGLVLAHSLADDRSSGDATQAQLQAEDAMYALGLVALALSLAFLAGVAVGFIRALWAGVEREAQEERNQLAEGAATVITQQEERRERKAHERRRNDLESQEGPAAIHREDSRRSVGASSSHRRMRTEAGQPPSAAGVQPLWVDDGYDEDDDYGQHRAGMTAQQRAIAKFGARAKVKISKMEAGVAPVM